MGNAPPAAAASTSFCLSAAESYYQQLYCEIQARGGGAALPGFADFKRNDPTVQALLLKRPAQKLGIEVVMPKRRSPPKRPAAQPSSGNRGDEPVAREANPRRSPSPPGAAMPVTRSGCRLAGREIRCGGDRFALVGNRRNEMLEKGALGAQNRMVLPAYDGSPADSSAFRRYLPDAYRRYLEKMLEIGLGGATMTFGKFALLLQDLVTRGVDFRKRFDTMYRFLKQDKRRMAVSERVQPPRGLDLTHCGDVSEALIACSFAGRNYLYQRAD